MHSHTIDTSNSDSTNEKPVSPEEINKIADSSQNGLNTKDSFKEENLIDSQDILVSERQGINENNTFFRVASALIIASVLGMVVFSIFSFWGKVSGGNNISDNNQEEKSTTSIESEGGEDELGNAKADLALSEQESDLQPPQLQFEPEVDREVETEPVSQPSTSSKPAVSATPVTESKTQKIEETNPLDEWARLAALGVSGGGRDVAIASLNRQDNEADTAESSRKSTNSSSPIRNKVNSPVSDNEVEESTASRNVGRDPVNQDRDPRFDRGEITRVASVSIGNLNLEKQSDSEKFDARNPAVQKLLGNRQSENSYLKRKAREYAEEDRLAMLTNTGVTSSYSQNSQSKTETAGREIHSSQFVEQVSDVIGQVRQIPESQDKLVSLELSPLEANNQEETFLERKAREYEEEDRLARLVELPNSTDQNSIESRTKQVPLGAVSEGEISTTIIWSEGLGSNNARGSINLSEPILADDGSVALPANSNLIVEVQGIASNGLALLNVIAVSYESNGKLKQELIPPGSILINGEENEPLIAEKTNDSGGTFLGQDVLIGLLGAGERGFEAINEPNSNTTVSNDLIVRSSSDNNVSLINGAAEGVFATTKERLEDRSDRILDEELERVPIYHLEAGKTVSIFINSFLEINR